MFFRWFFLLPLLFVPGIANAEYLYAPIEDPLATPVPPGTPDCTVCPTCGDCTRCGHRPAICRYHDTEVAETMKKLAELADRLGEMCRKVLIGGGFEDPRAALDELIELDHAIIDLVIIYQVHDRMCPCSTAADKSEFTKLIDWIQVRHDCVYRGVSYSPTDDFERTGDEAISAPR